MLAMFYSEGWPITWSYITILLHWASNGTDAHRFTFCVRRNGYKLSEDFSPATEIFTYSLQIIERSILVSKWSSDSVSSTFTRGRAYVF